MQAAAVTIIVLLAALFVARRLYRSWKLQARGGCGCSGCGGCDSQ